MEALTTPINLRCKKTVGSGFSVAARPHFARRLDGSVVVRKPKVDGGRYHAEPNQYRQCDQFQFFHASRSPLFGSGCYSNRGIYSTPASKTEGA